MTEPNLDSNLGNLFLKSCAPCAATSKTVAMKYCAVLGAAVLRAGCGGRAWAP